MSAGMHDLCILKIAQSKPGVLYTLAISDNTECHCVVSTHAQMFIL